MPSRLLLQPGAATPAGLNAARLQHQFSIRLP
jgi:hypothetical protein